MSDTSSRPRVVTMAGWIIMVGSVFVVLMVFERMAGLGSLETRETAERMLQPDTGTGMTVEDVLVLLEIAGMVAGGCAAATAVLGFHVLRRSRGARMGVTVLALPLFISGTMSGGFLSSMVAFSAILLWLEPSRDWFEGRAPRRTPEPALPGAPASSSAPDPSWPPPSAPSTPPPPQPTAQGPRPHQGFGAPPPEPKVWATQVQAHPHRPVAAGTPGARPSAVLWACILTWTFSAMATVLMGMSALVVATAPDLVFEQLQQQPEVADQGLSDGAITRALYAVTALTVAWSLAASVIAVLLHRGVRWARVALLASTGGVAAVALLGVLQSPVVMLVPLVAAAVTISLLVRPEVRRWVAAP